MELSRTQLELVAGYAFLATALFCTVHPNLHTRIGTHLMADAALVMTVVLGRDESSSRFEAALRFILAMAALAFIALASM